MAYRVTSVFIFFGTLLGCGGPGYQHVAINNSGAMDDSVNSGSRANPNEQSYSFYGEISVNQNFNPAAITDSNLTNKKNLVPQANLKPVVSTKTRPKLINDRLEKAAENARDPRKFGQSFFNRIAKNTAQQLSLMDPNKPRFGRWASAETVPDGPGKYEVPVKGSPWNVFKPSVETSIPVQGTKFHVTADRGAERAVLDRVLPYLRENNIAHKYAHEEGFKQLDEDPVQAGKLIVIYPKDDAQGEKILRDLDQIARQYDLGTHREIQGDLRVGPFVFARYGRIRSSNDQDVEGHIPIGYVLNPVTQELVRDKLSPFPSFFPVPPYLQRLISVYSND